MEKNQNTCSQAGEDKKNKNQRNTRVIKTAALCLVIGLMASAIAGLGVALYYSTEEVRTHESYQRQMDAVYFRAYYDLIDGANDMGISLKKLGASSSATMQQSLLYDVWSSAGLAEASLGVFEGEGEGLSKAQRFINQLGDYAHSLALRVTNGEPLTVEERTKLAKLGKVVEAYLAALEKLKEDVDAGKLFVGEGGALEGIDSAFAPFAEPSFEYPEMIYDGPFSDALVGRAPVALTGQEMSVEDGAQAVKAYFENASDVRFSDEGKGDIPTLNYTFTLDGAAAFAQIGKFGGKLIAFSTAGGERRAAIEEAGVTCQCAALDFAEKLGFENMRVVWSSSADGECVVNLAPVEGEVILYPDLVKVKLRESDSTVTGFDAAHYALNHKQRSLSTPVVSEESAAAGLSIPPLGEGKLALIPIRGTREVLTYEYECEQGGTYFVYIDALTGDEVNILYVIDSEEQGMRTA